MPNTIAQVMQNYSRVMPESGRGMADAAVGYRNRIAQARSNEAAARQQGFENTLAMAKEGREQAKEQRADTEFKRKEKVEQMKQWLGPATAADTQEKWARAQDQGFISKELSFDKREPFIMATMTESERLARQSEPSLEVYDPNSPTGTTHMRRSEAYGKPGKPPSGMAIDVGEDGTVSVRQGRGVGTSGSALTKPTKNLVQKRLLDKGETMALINGMKAGFKPEYQQIGKRAGFAWDAMRSKLGDTPLAGLIGQVSPEDEQALMDFADYRANAAQNFATTLKDISGVAVNPTEFKRTETWLPNPGTGIFDGDSPPELLAKIERFEQFTRRAMAKYHYFNKHGLTIDDVDVDDMPYMINARGNELEAEYSSQGLEGDALNSAIKAALSEEFGLAR